MKQIYPAITGTKKRYKKGEIVFSPPLKGNHFSTKSFIGRVATDSYQGIPRCRLDECVYINQEYNSVHYNRLRLATEEEIAKLGDLDILILE